MQLSELGRLDYYEYRHYVKRLADDLETQRKHQEEQKKSSGKDSSGLLSKMKSSMRIPKFKK